MAPAEQNEGRTLSGADLQQIVTTRITDRSFENIAVQISQCVINGFLKVGDKLPNERDLGAVFGVSRNTAREALRVLEANGVVRVRRGALGGVFITKPGGDAVGRALYSLLRFRGVTATDLEEFRSSFEGQNACLAAVRGTEHDVRAIASLAQSYTDGVRAHRPWDALVEIDSQFHLAVAEASKNGVRPAILLALLDTIERLSGKLSGVADESYRVSAADDLMSIARAIATRDPAEAERRMVSHVEFNASLEVRYESAPLVGTVNPPAE